MKKFEVELQYTSCVIYTIEAENETEAEDKAWKELKENPKHGCGEWLLTSIDGNDDE